MIEKLKVLWNIRLLKAFFLYIIVFFVLITITYLGERSIQGHTFKSFADAIWWGIVTSTTVGYGDIVPVSAIGKLVASILMISSLLFMSAVTATVASKFVQEKILEEMGKKTFKDRDHILICGWNDFGIKVLRSIIRETLSGKPIFYLINELNQEEIDSIRYELEGSVIKFIKGNFVSESVLFRANIEKASKVIILGDKSHDGTFNKADERTILASLTVKGLAPDIPTFAELLDKDNEIYLKRAKIDEIVIRGELDSSLLGIASVSPAILKLLNNLIDPDYPDFIWEVPIPEELIGKTYEEVRNWFISTNNGLPIGLSSKTKGYSLDQILGGASVLIGEFIKEQLEEVSVSVGSKQEFTVELNPELNKKISKNEHIIIIHTQKPFEENS